MNAKPNKPDPERSYLKLLLTLLYCKEIFYDCDGNSCFLFRCATSTVNFFVTDVTNGFSVSGPDSVMEGESAKLKCSASVYNFTDVQWFKYVVGREVLLDENSSRNEDAGMYKIVTDKTEFSMTKELVFPKVGMISRGKYFCMAKPRGEEGNGSFRNRKHSGERRKFYNDASVEHQPSKVR